MATWKNVLKLGDKEEKQRESAFEATMLAELAKATHAPVKPRPPVVSKPVAVATSLTPDSLTITLIEAGQTTTYTDLAAVPVALRQRIVNAWIASSSK